LYDMQEKAESRVSHIHVELREAEKELSVLERELQEIDQIERDLHELTHERELLLLGITGAPGVGATGKPGKGGGAGAAARAAQAESYALEIAIHRKRAEREKRRQELDAEFAAVFQDVQRKKQALGRLEVYRRGGAPFVCCVCWFAFFLWWQWLWLCVWVYLSV
jgi:DNA repair exonuclease SbcCD ATPase subunit